MSGQRFAIEVPATSANCSVGFDCLGLALDWMGRFEFETGEGIDEISVSGCPDEFCNEENLVVQSVKNACGYMGFEMPKFHLNIQSDVPFARGLGSSSCCVAAGVLAAMEFAGYKADEDLLLEIASHIEGHPDNAAPALFGAMNACFKKDKKYIRSRFDIADFKALAIIPPYEVSTPKARKVLPKTLDFQDAVAQVGHALVFEKALEEGDQEKLFDCCQDVLHEPYRRRLIPDYDLVSDLCAKRQLPFWISGSGPTMLALSKDPGQLEELETVLKEKAPHLQTRLLDMCKSGARVLESS